MKILIVSDEECPSLWDYYIPGRLAGYDLIISCGDLNASYLSFLVTMARCPLLYVHGNHDTRYNLYPPEGCDCIEDRIVEYNGLRILGLGGCRKYHPGPHQYTDDEMRRRIRKLRLALRRTGGVDLVVTHAPPRGLGDGEDPAHWGFEALVELLDKYQPRYLVHGHVHTSYGNQTPRVRPYGATTLINACERYELEIPEIEIPESLRGQLVWRSRQRWPDQDGIPQR